MPARELGLFITLEGVEGVGKSTAASGLAALLRAEGFEVMLTREPGGTKAAEDIRQLLLKPDLPLAPMAQTMLHFAARADHVEQAIRPALAQGKIVICDRFYDSTLAYQAYGLGVALEDVQALIRLICLKPDVTFLLDLPKAQTLQRLMSRGGATDRYEDMEQAFFDRVRVGFNAILKSEPERFMCVDASPPVDELVATLRQLVFKKTGR